MEKTHVRRTRALPYRPQTVVNAKPPLPQASKLCKPEKIEKQIAYIIIQGIKRAFIAAVSSLYDLPRPPGIDVSWVPRRRK